MTIRHYGALIGLYIASFAAACYRGQAAEQEQRAAGRFTTQQIVTRAKFLTRLLAPEESADRLEWSAFSQVVGSSAGAAYLLWRVDGETGEDFSRRGVYLTLDAESGALLHFTYSTGQDLGRIDPTQRMSPQETLRRAQEWLRVYEQNEQAYAAPPDPWRLVSVTEAGQLARSVSYRSGKRVVQIKMHPVSGDLLLLSFRQDSQ